MKHDLHITLSVEATDKLFSEYCRRVTGCKPNFSKSSIIEELIIEHLELADKHFDINNI